MKKIILSIVLLLFYTNLYAEEASTPPEPPPPAVEQDVKVKQESLAQHLQDVSVTIRVENNGSGSQGSGVIVTRELKLSSDSEEKKKVNFVWTAAHVVKSLRGTREVIDPKTGQSRTVVQFRDASIVKELVENGRRVGELKMDAQVIRYSDADNGEDVALLMIRKQNFVDASAAFYIEEPGILPIGTKLYHVGSLLGQLGANSMTEGIMSQVGRVVNLGNGAGVIFDQTTTTAFPGCIRSNGIIYTDDGYKKIIDIKPGDTVLTYNNTITNNINHKISNNNCSITNGKVIKVWSTGKKQVFRLSTRNKFIEATGNHPFVKAVPVYSINGKKYWIAQWCPLESLQKGDIVATIKEYTNNINEKNILSEKWKLNLITTDLLPKGLKWERIANIEPLGIEEVYDMEIESYHNFFANGFLVHNSSGGGVFLTEANGDNKGKYCGMLVRGAGETFNLIVPVRRMIAWAKKAQVEWALNENIELPDLETLYKLPVEDIGVKFDAKVVTEPTIATYPNLHFWIQPYIPAELTNTEIIAP